MESIKPTKKIFKVLETHVTQKSLHNGKTYSFCIIRKCSLEENLELT